MDPIIVEVTNGATIQERNNSLRDRINNPNLDITKIEWDNENSQWIIYHQ